jgi:dihydroxyacetone kinase-like predicted kinase
VCAAAATALDAVVALTDTLLADGGELVTVIVGDGAAEADVAGLTEHLAIAHPDVEIEVHRGKQPLYPFVLGVE